MAQIALHSLYIVTSSDRGNCKAVSEVLEACTEQDEFEFLMIQLGLYRRAGLAEKLAAVKNRLSVLLPRQSMNQYFLERARATIEQT